MYIYTLLCKSFKVLLLNIKNSFVNLDLDFNFKFLYVLHNEVFLHHWKDSSIAPTAHEKYF